MNVLILAQYFPPDLGGSATRAYNVAKGLSLNGCRVTVIAAFPHYPYGKIPKEYNWKPIKLEFMDNFKVIRTFMPPVRSRGFLRRLLLIGSFAFSALFALPFVGKIDVVWTTSWVPGLVYGKLKRKPVALNVDDLTLEDIVYLGLIRKNSFILKIAEWIYRFFYVKADVVTPISPGYIETLEGKYCVKPDRIRVVRCGVDLSKFGLNGPDSIDRDNFVILYSGAFSVGYDFDQVLLAAKRLESYNDIVFVLQGGGELAEYLKNKVVEFGLKNVVILDKILSRDEVANFLKGAEALLLPLKDYGKPYLGFSSKLYEYQAVGKPIICCAVGQPADYIKDTGSGVVVKPGDFEGLAKAVLFLKQNPDAARKMGLSGRRYVEEHLSIQAIGLELKRVLEASCKSKCQFKSKTDGNVS
ncbi:MAG: glycosyltransferase family 4 protein [Thermoproteota archaeon]